MGEAKRRGTREQRIAQATERRKLEKAALHEQYQREEAERRSRIAALPPEKRREVILAGPGSLGSRLLLAHAMAALALPPEIITPSTRARSE